MKVSDPPLVADIPPIPPECEYFCTAPDGRRFFDVPEARDNDSHSYWLHDPDDMRPIIAAVARCAWLDEARTWFIRALDSSCKWIKQKPLERKKEAEMYAEAWAEWGRKND